MCERLYFDLVNKKNYNYTMFPIAVAKHKHKQKDGWSCGVFSLLNCLSLLKNVDVTEQIQSDEEMNRTLDFFRLSILSLIDDMWTAAFGVVYEDYRHQFEYPQDVKVGEDMLKRWRNIHYLYNGGHFKFKDGVYAQLSMKDKDIKDTNLERIVKKKTGITTTTTTCTNFNIFNNITSVASQTGGHYYGGHAKVY